MSTQLLKDSLSSWLIPLLKSQPNLRSLIIRLGLTSAATWVVARYIVYRLYLHPANSIPGPRVDWIPLLGNMREILRDPVSTLAIMQHLVVVNNLIL